MNVIAFSLYGNDPKYTVGAIRNAWLAPIIYPGWEVHIWFDELVPPNIVENLRRMNVRLHQMDGSHPQKMFYRFLAHDLSDVDRYLVRDADSRLTELDRSCVEDWISDGTLLHSIRDHPYHNQPLMGGGWGMWRSKVMEIPSMNDLIRTKQWSSIVRYGQDQDFLTAEVWNRLKHSCTQHDDFNTGRFTGIKRLPRPDNWPKEAFFLEVFDSDNQPNEQHRAMRK